MDCETAVDNEEYQVQSRLSCGKMRLVMTGIASKAGHCLLKQHFICFQALG